MTDNTKNIISNNKNFDNKEKNDEDNFINHELISRKLNNRNPSPTNNPKKNSKSNLNNSDKFLEESNDMEQLNIINNEEPLEENLNLIIDKCGYGHWAPWRNMLFYFLFAMHEGFMLIYFTTISTAFKDYYEISEGLLSFIGASVFLGKSIGTSISGLMLNFFNRRQLILFSCFGILISNLLMSQIKNLVVFTIFRIIGAIFLGFYMPSIMCILSEYLPTKFRGFSLTIAWSGMSTGVIYFLLFCMIYIPNLSYIPLKDLERKMNGKIKDYPKQDFHSAIFSIFYISFINLILLYFFLKDSPRNLLLNKKKEEAAEIIETYVKRKLTNREIDNIYENLISSGENKYLGKKSDYKLLFSKRYLILVLIMSFIFFLFSFGWYGIAVTIPILMRKNELENNSGEFDNKIPYLILLNFQAIPILGAILAEVKILGKKYWNIILMFICAIFGIFCIIFQRSITSLYLVCNLSLINSFALVSTWSAEIFPTKIRDTAIGFFFGTTRFGGFVSQLIFITVAYHNPYICFGIFIASAILLIILLSLVPNYEIQDLDSSLDLSHENQLDLSSDFADDSDNDNEENKLK